MMTNVERVYQKYVRKRFPLPSEADVTSLEIRIEAALPPEYRRFLLEYNGGWFRDHHLNLPSDRSPDDRLDGLYGIGASHEVAEVGKPRDMSLFDNNDPPQIVIIGNTVMNQLLILGVHPENYGEVYFKTFTEFFFLADSLEEFFGLISDPVDD